MSTKSKIHLLLIGWNLHQDEFNCLYNNLVNLQNQKLCADISKWTIIIGFNAISNKYNAAFTFYRLIFIPL